ncbi:alpha-2-glucosyltransferase Alg10 [Obelidium mucronatum]|nr:alpha-2-glucosyltransferase Alg10 [Obelidium mucronatum]
MDEIFHIPQAQRYCAGNWSYYDEKLTTPPGLYIASLVILKPFTSIIPDLCSVSSLRFTNVLFYIGSLIVFGKLLNRTRSTSSFNLKNWVETFVIGFFPLSYFFHFLYYTDSGSTLFTFWGFLLALEGNHVGSAALSLIAMTFRQTNVIWMLFAAGATVIDTLSDKRNPITKGSLSTELSLSSVSSLVVLGFTHFFYLITIIWPYFVSLGLFGAYIVWNGGIVLGDKSNHVAQLHVVQVFYFSGFSAFFLAPAIQLHDKVGSLVRTLRTVLATPKGLIVLALVPVAFGWIISRFTIEHPFLLADNRHFTFYIWKYIFRSSPYLRYTLIPGYIAALWILWTHLSTAKSSLYSFLFFICLGLTLIPSPLMEFRYYIIPYLLLRILAKPTTWTSLGLEFLLYSGINLITFWLFLERPFVWESEPGKLQRFMY